MPRTIPEVIRDQIGGQALTMLGAYNLLQDSKTNNPYLSFRIRGSRKINYIKISYTLDDLYEMEFGQVRKFDYKVVDKHGMVCADQLHDIISDATGLATSLHPY